MYPLLVYPRFQTLEGKQELHRNDPRQFLSALRLVETTEIEVAVEN